MPIEPTGAATQTFGGIHSGSTPSTAKKELDSETFLNLLVAQLRYQDPTAPMDTTEMMAQTTQLASMEQLTTLTTTMTESFALQMRSSAAQFVGHAVTYLDAEGKEQSGVVTSASFADAVPTVTIGDVVVPLDAVMGLRSTTAPVPGTETDTDTDTDAAPDAATDVPNIPAA